VRQASLIAVAGNNFARWVLLLMAAVAALLALELLEPAKLQVDTRSAEPPPLRKPAPGFPDSYGEALAELDRSVSNAASLADARKGEWLIQESLARRLIARGRLSGSFQDYAAAQSALRKAFATAPAGAGPHMTQAVLDFTMHRLGSATAALQKIDRYAVAPDPGDLAEIAAMRGDISFYSGDYSRALKLYDLADHIMPGTGDFRRAVYHSKTGRPDLAEKYLDRTERRLTRPSPQLLANLELQRGLLDLDRGRRDEALHHFREADRFFAGNWLIEEHIAEVIDLLGRPSEAAEIYDDIIQRTGHPEFMDARASIALEQGDRSLAALWERRAAESWQVRLALFPEAAYGHALKHCLQFQKAGCALQLAQRNHTARPYGEAKIALARALLINNRVPEAKAMIEAVVASPWRSGELRAVAADIRRR
jgi:tetratricopeptide (TPR) repeat protein